MKISELIDQLNDIKSQYGDIETYVLVNAGLNEPLLLHSEADYTENMFFGGSSWEELGLTTPALIIDYDGHNILDDAVFEGEEDEPHEPQ